MEEAPDNCVLLLLSSYNSSLDAPSYSLLKLDSLLKPIWNKPIPGNVRLSSLKKVSNNEYLLSGNFTTGNTDQFAITRITAEGNLIWTKYISNLSGKNVYTIPTSDGGILTIGDTSDVMNPFPVIVKCGNDGAEMWRKSFNTGIGTSIRYPDNIIETSDGYLFASTKPNNSWGSVILTKLDFAGNTVQQTETAAGNWGTIFRAGVVNNGQVYMVYAVNSIAWYYFNSNLAFSSSAQTYYSGINHAMSYNGSFYLAEGSHQFAHIFKVSNDGSLTWAKTIGNNIPISCSSIFSGATRYCKKVLCTPTDIFALSYGQNNATAFNSSSVYIEKLNPSDGSAK